MEPASFYQLNGMSEWHEVEDIQLIQLAKDGSADAFGELYERHAQSVFRFIYAHLDSRQDAEDLMDDVFLRVWNSLSGYREKGVPFIAFLFRIARNGIIDHYRRSKQTKQTTSIEELPLRDWQPEPGESVMTAMEHQEVRLVLERLREDYRTVLVLRFLSELTPDETAQVMGRTTGAIRVLQHRALMAMRELLEE
jgi:RNA polymerase sigma-70 factor (ECF subfamily)